MSHVFISYKREDKAFAKELEAKLREVGFEVWIDEHIPGGKDWLKEIELKIHEAFAVVLVATPEAMKSEWVNYEWIFARGAGIDVVPIHLRTVTEFPCRLSDYQLIDFREFYDWGNLFISIDAIQGERGQGIFIPPKASRPVREALEKLNSSFPEERIIGAKRLGDLHDPLAIPSLITLLRDADLDVRDACTKSLGKIPDERSAEGLLDYLIEYHRSGGDISHIDDDMFNSYDVVICSVLKKLGSIAVPSLIKGLRHHSAEIRKVSAILIGRIKDKRAVPALIEAVNDNDDEARRCIIWAMGPMQDQACVPIIIAELKKDNIHTVKFECIQQLGYIGDKRAFEPLIEILVNTSNQDLTSSSPQQLRAAAAQALGTLGDKRAVKPLFDIFLDESQTSIGISALNSLKLLVDNSHLEMLIEMMQRSKNFPLNQYSLNLLLDVIHAIGTPEALAAVEQWRQQQTS